MSEYEWSVAFKGVIWPEVIAEGFPDMEPVDFMETYIVNAQGIGPMDDVTRIEWRYLDGVQR